MTRYVPVVAFVDQDVIAKLQPFVDDIAARLERAYADETPMLTWLRLSGSNWTQVAWGRVIAGVADSDLTLTVEGGEEVEP